MDHKFPSNVRRTRRQKLGSVSRRVLDDVAISVPVGPQTFEFHLTHEQVDLGPNVGWIDYFAFDGSAIRDRAGINNASITGAYRASWPLFNPPVNEADVRMYLLAETHRTLGRRDSVHDVYRSQYLHSDASRCESLCPNEIAQLRKLVHARQAQTVQSVLDGFFLGHLPSASEAPTFANMYEQWMASGLRLWNAGADRGLTAWLKHMTEQFRSIQRRSRKKYDQRGLGDRMHRFLGYFAYEAFVAFQRCCLAAWQFILPVLKERYSINGHSMDFMCFMHGIASPDVGQDGATATRGFLCGQALSLHPVGRWLLDRPEHLARIGDWLRDPCRSSVVGDQDRLLAHLGYQEVLVALLCCAQEYTRARDGSENQRTGRRHGCWLPNASHPRSPGSADGVDDFFVAEAIAMTLLPSNKRTCPQCRSLPLQYKRLESAAEHIRIRYDCRCGYLVDHLFDLAVVADAIGLYRRVA